MWNGGNLQVAQFDCEQALSRVLCDCFLVDSLEKFAQVQLWTAGHATDVSEFEPCCAPILLQAKFVLHVQ